MNNCVHKRLKPALITYMRHIHYERICMNVYVCVHMCVYIYMYIYTWIHVYI